VNHFFEYHFSIRPIVFASAVLLLCLAVWVSPAQAQQAASKTDSPAGNAAKGKENLKKFGCSQCHGYSGNGGSGPRLAQTPLTFAAFVSYARRPKRAMPPYGTQLTESEFADIYAYLKSVPPSPAAKSIPMLNTAD